MILHEDLVPLQVATTMVTVKHGERKKDILKNAADAGDEGQHDSDELLFFFLMENSRCWNLLPVVMFPLMLMIPESKVSHWQSVKFD